LESINKLKRPRACTLHLPPYLFFFEILRAAGLIAWKVEVFLCFMAFLSSSCRETAKTNAIKTNPEGGIFSLICFTKEIGMGTLAPVEKRTIAQKTPQKKNQNS
jgi:hypothetical protein